MIHAFADCEVDEARFELCRRGAVVKVEPKTFDVLAYLVKCADRVVSKDELLDAVWPGQAVSESVLPKCVAAARRAVGDTRAGPAGPSADARNPEPTLGGSPRRVATTSF